MGVMQKDSLSLVLVLVLSLAPQMSHLVKLSLPNILQDGVGIFTDLVYIKKIWMFHFCLYLSNGSTNLMAFGRLVQYLVQNLYSKGKGSMLLSLGDMSEIMTPIMSENL